MAETRSFIRSRPARGVTAIETLVVVAILAIVLAVTAPSFRGFLEGQQLKSLAYDLTTDLLMARSEALKRNGSVVLSAGSRGWEGGWTMATVSPAVELRRRDGKPGAVAVSDAPAAITFDFNGRVSAPAGDLRITLSSGANSPGRCVELDLSGRARSLVGVCT